MYIGYNILSQTDKDTDGQRQGPKGTGKGTQTDKDKGPRWSSLNKKAAVKNLVPLSL
jgi:hypothetical protein